MVIGEICAYGYGYNNYGECVLKARVCEPRYVLNLDGTKCIPVPGVYIPFLFVMLALGWTAYILIDNKKHKHSIEVIIT